MTRVQQSSRLTSTGWCHDLTTGQHALLIAGTGEEVTALSQRARLDRVAASATQRH
jgi:hypothetical protein